MLQQNQVAAVSTDDSILAGLAAQDPQRGWSGRPVQRRAVRHGDRPATPPTWSGSSTAVLARMRADGTWTRLYTRWLTALGPAPQPPTARYRD